MNAELTFLNALQALRTPVLDGVMHFFTHLGDSGFVWLVLTALLLAFRRTRRAGWVLAAAALSCPPQAARRLRLSRLAVSAARTRLVCVLVMGMTSFCLDGP